MRAHAEAEVVAPGPVAEVVAALLSIAREVADLVLMEPRARERIHRSDIQRRDELVVRNHDTAALDEHLERSALLEVEHVERDVSDAARDRLAERRFE